MSDGPREGWTPMSRAHAVEPCGRVSIWQHENESCLLIGPKRIGPNSLEDQIGGGGLVVIAGGHATRWAQFTNPPWVYRMRFAW